MNKQEENNIFHRCSGNVYTVDITKVSDEDQEFLSEKLLCLLKQGVILVNENVDGWQAARNLLVGLDVLPHALLEDLYLMESERYKGKEYSPVTNDPGEAIRRILYYSYIPNLLKAHRVKKHF